MRVYSWTGGSDGFVWVSVGASVRVGAGGDKSFNGGK